MEDIWREREEEKRVASRIKGGRKRRGREEYLLAVPFTTISLSSPSENECRLGW